MKPRSAYILSLVVILFILFLDQSSKIWVKTHMHQGQEILILGQSWARIHFVENEGMAFGLSFGGAAGKLALSIFRILAVFFLFYLLGRLIKSKENPALVLAFSMILAGALGNIIDSAFYGMLFSYSPFHGGVAQLLPPEGGYAPFLMGRVVDMFYFPLIQSTFPTWVPIWGGQEFEFFRPVFNFADSSIFVGISLFLIFYRKLSSENIHHNIKENTDNQLDINKKASETEVPEAAE
ncbi:MAG: lipoprotein signal peptidase [Saprospiraceae bacterium]|nr:lipoprotein signal peptidase [Candidatus Vicinibacter affinis]MBP6172744.1 lipoprotein signal peptidase [Saprospiraceae bacterium]MBK6573434.1 lipoprotein signal peptidase [Candidatus Vicinibacter affinis]MBK6822090.1 lipoprotein signal peptidase [Candidatus Vicinibacter affinis]MBK7302114.1 lipoprotein signal peptidase [Candidatus Vicinibacter affinis]